MELVYRCPIPKMRKEINDFYVFFGSRRVGAIKARAFPKALRDLVIQKFGSANYVDQLTVSLAEAIVLIVRVYSLRGDIHLEELRKGMEEDIIRHLQEIDQLWARMDKALVMLARQKYEYDRHRVTSEDGMKILENAIFAVPLHDFLENLDLLRDDKFIETIEDWRESMESIIVVILKNLGRNEEANEIIKTSEETKARLELRMDMKKKYRFGYWRFSTAL